MSFSLHAEDSSSCSFLFHCVRWSSYDFIFSLLMKSTHTLDVDIEVLHLHNETRLVINEFHCAIGSAEPRAIVAPVNTQIESITTLEYISKYSIIISGANVHISRYILDTFHDFFVNSRCCWDTVGGYVLPETSLRGNLKSHYPREVRHPLRKKDKSPHGYQI